MQVITDDQQEFTITEEYSQGSSYFQAIQHYQQNPELGLPVQLSVEFSSHDLQVITVPVQQLDHNQVLTAYTIDQFFQHQSRIEELESRIIYYWLIGVYNCADTNSYQHVNQLVNSIIFTNIRVATKIWLRRLSHYNSEWSALQNRIYWVDVRQQVLENIVLEDLVLLPQDDSRNYSQCLKLVERLAQPHHIIDRATSNNNIKLANDYLALIAGVKCPIRLEFAALIRYDDLNNPNLNHLYRAYIIDELRHYNTVDLQSISYYQLIDRIKLIINEYTDVRLQNDDHTQRRLHILENPDERVIKEFLTILAKHGVNRIEGRHIRYVYHYASTAAVKLLDLNVETVLNKTNQSKTFVDLLQSQSVDNYNHSGWSYSNQCVNELINHVITSDTELISDILKTPQYSHLVPCVLLFQYDRQLANLIAQLGGRIQLRDLDMDRKPGAAYRILDIATLEFALSHQYTLTEGDLEYIEKLLKDKRIVNTRTRELLTRMGVIVEVENDNITVRQPITLDSITRTINLKPSGIKVYSWLSSISTIDRIISSGQIMSVHNLEMSCGRTITLLDSNIDYYGSLIDYIDQTGIHDQNVICLLEVIRGWILELRKEIERIGEDGGVTIRSVNEGGITRFIVENNGTMVRTRDPDYDGIPRSTVNMIRGDTWNSRERE